VSHGSLANYTAFAERRFGINPSDRVLQFSSISFDTAAEEIYPCLVGGATLVLRPGGAVDTVATFLERCGEWGVTVLDLPTAFWHEITASLFYTNLPLPECLRLVVIGGERVITERLLQWQQCVGDKVQLLHGYGPTGTQIVATMCELPNKICGNNTSYTVTVGSAVWNIQVYLLDEELRPVPVGVPSEMYIGGVGVARGYLNRPALTAEKFIPDPLGGAPGARLYKTG